MRKIALIVEDSDTMVQIYVALLSEFDILFDIANNTKEALQYMRQKEYDIYIFDIILQNNENGMDLIGKGGATPDKCIILSGNLPETTVWELIELYKITRENIMSKPPDNHHFKNIVSKLLEDKPEIHEHPVPVTIKHEPHVSPDITIDNFHTKVIWPHFKKVLENLSIKQWIIVVFTVLSIPSFIGPYITSVGYNSHKEFIKTLENNCEERFKNFKKGDKITSKTYLEQTLNTESVSFEVRIYPENFVSILMTSNDDKFEPRKYWVYGPEYVKHQGLDKEVSTLDIIKKLILGE